MTQKNPDELDLQIFTVPPGADLLTPGEVRAIQMTYSTFHQILSSGSTLFAQVYASEWARAHGKSRPRGALLTIQSVRKVSSGDPQPGNYSAGAAALPPAPPVVTAEVRCTGRADVIGCVGCDSFVGELADPAPWTVLRGTAHRVRDDRADGIDRRLRISEAEWEAWKLCIELEELRLRLETSSTDSLENKGNGSESNSAAMTRDRMAPLRVWAPRDYDRSILEHEWAATPPDVRNLWQSRAEALSFAILRHVNANDECMREAMSLTSTTQRFVLGQEKVAEEKLLTLAKMSINGALRNMDANDA